MKILIVGCRGFVGGSLGRAAVRAGHAVCGVARSGQPEVDWPGEYLQADAALSDFAPLLTSVRPDLVVHAAGPASVAASFASPHDDFRGAVGPLANLLEGVRRSGLRPLLFVPSSAAVYGQPESLPVAETAATRPVSPYGFHKLSCELLAREYAECFGLDIVVGRFFSLYGPRQRRLLLWELFRKASSADAEVVLDGTGEETRDYLHIDDAAAAVLAIAEARPRGLHVVNVASGTPARVADLAALVLQSVGRVKPIRTAQEHRAGDPPHWVADVRLLRNVWSAAPRTIERGVAGCVGEWGPQGA